MVVGPVDDGTAEAFLPIVEDHRLARRDGPGRVVELNRDLLAILADMGGHANVLLAVAELGRAVEVTTVAADHVVDPVNVTGFQVGRVEVRVVITLPDVKDVLVDVLADHEPGLVALLVPTETQAAPLTDCVVHQPHVLTDDLTVDGLHVPRLGRDVLAEEFPEVAILTDEADPDGVLLVRRGQTGLLGNLPDLRLSVVGQGEHDLVQLVVVQLTQEVGLVLVLVGGPHQVHPAIGVPLEVRVVPRGHVIRPQLVGVVDKGLELDLLVADDVGVRRPPLLVLGNEVLEDPVPVLLLKVDRVVGNTDLGGYLGHVLVVLGGGTNPVLVGVVPVLHEDTNHVITLPLEQQGGHGGVDTPAHPNNNTCVTVISHFLHHHHFK